MRLLFVLFFAAEIQSVSVMPTQHPTSAPMTSIPTRLPSAVPITPAPTSSQPSVMPSGQPTTSQPSILPTNRPITSHPSLVPSVQPSSQPSTTAPTTSVPTAQPTGDPSSVPSSVPSAIVSSVPLSEIQTLKDIFDSAGGDGWLWSADPADGVQWNFSVVDLDLVDPCEEGAQWQRVRCLKSSGTSASIQHIVELNLTQFGLVGTLPFSLGNLSALNILSFRDNDLEHRLPSSIGLMTCLETFYADLNSLTGPLPSTIGAMMALRDLDLDNNRFSSSLPTTVGLLSALQYMDLDNNLLSGPIPQEMRYMRNLVDLDLDKNRFTGTIPSIFGTLPSLQYLSLDTNKLRGKIPTSLGSLTQLRVLSLQKNQLTGPVNRFLWQYSNMSFLFGIDVSNNRLTGRLKPSLFRLPALQILSLSVNCFKGPLPDAVCEASQAVVLSMDTLSSADECGNAVRAPLITKLLYEDFSGSIPSCLWRLPNISEVHLSGNGLKGRLGSIPPTSLLKIVSLTHNKLSGPIPKSFQRWSFDFFDLSYNKFAGDLSSQISDIYSLSSRCTPAECTSNSTSRIDLSINRLSGSIPGRLEDARRINILTGNLFGCNGAAPEHDSDSTFFVCGSSLLDNALVWLAIVSSLSVALGAVVMGVLVINTRKYKIAKDPRIVHFHALLLQCRAYWDVCDFLTTESLPGLQSFCSLLTQICQGISSLALVGALLLLPVYILKAVDVGESEGRFTTHMHMYRWVLSIVYVTGNVPGALVLCAWAFMMFMATYVLRMAVQSREDVDIKPNERETEMSNLSSSTDAAEVNMPSAIAHPPRVSEFSVAATVGDEVTALPPMQIALGRISDFGRSMLNFSVVLTVNMAYVYSTMKDLSRSQTAFIQFSLAGFMLFWNFVVVPSRLLTHAENPVARVWTKVSMLVLNSIALPCLATALQSPSCFRGLFVDANKIETTYSYVECSKFIESRNVTVTSTCVEYDPITVQVTSVVPPFTYSYQCSSELITSYTPVFLYSYIFLSVVPPLVYLSLATFWPDHTSVPLCLRSRLPGVLYPDMWSTQPPLDVPIAPTKQPIVNSPLQFDNLEGQAARSTGDNTSFKSSHSSKFTAHLSLVDPDSGGGGKLKCAEARQLLRSDNILAPMLMHTSVLLTFGLCCPYLAAAICLAVTVAVIRWRLLLGRFVLWRFKVSLKYDAVTEAQLKAKGDINVVKIQNDSGYCDVVDRPELSGMDFCLVVLNETLRDMHVTAEMCLWLQVYVGALFFGVLCWDITADRRGFWNSLWVPICALCVVLLLRLYTSRSHGRVVFQHERELDTRMTLRTMRMHRHSAGDSMDLTGPSRIDVKPSVDEKVRMWKMSVLLEDVMHKTEGHLDDI